MIITDLSTIYGQIRLILGDTEPDQGPFPTGRNFTDEELLYLYNQENQSAGKAAAAAAEILARAWSSAPKEEVLGPHKTKHDAVKHWQSEAVNLRRLYGGGAERKAIVYRLGPNRVIDELRSS